MPGTCVLYVDDEPQTCKWFARMFGDEFIVRTAESMAQALALLRQPRSDIAVAVVDYRMPGGSGLDLLRAMQAEGFGQVVPLLATARVDRDVCMAAINEGHVIRIVEKPFGAEVMRAALRQAAQAYQLRQQHRLVRAHRAEAMHETLRFLEKEMAPVLRGMLDNVAAIRGFYQPQSPSDPVLRAADATSASAVYCQSLLLTFLESVQQALPAQSAQVPPAAGLIQDLLDDFPFSGRERDWVSCEAAQQFDAPGRRDMVRLVLHALLKDILLSLQTTPGPMLRIAAGMEPRGTRPWIRFTDNGPGFEPSKLMRLALAPSGDLPDEGAGAGLAFCRRILQSLGGAVEVSRDAAGHNSVSLYFPTLPLPAQPKEA